MRADPTILPFHGQGNCLNDSDGLETMSNRFLSLWKKTKVRMH